MSPKPPRRNIGGPDYARGVAAFDFRASRARAVRRQEKDEPVELCPTCLTELDVPVEAHEPRCPEFKREKDSGRDESLYTMQGGLKVEEIERRYRERVTSKEQMTVGCSHCGWQGFTGPGEAAVAEQERHMQESHPNLVQRKTSELRAEYRARAIAAAEAMWGKSDGSEPLPEVPPDA